MSTHTVDGYLALLKMRGGKNLLVEGPSDRRALARLVREFETAFAGGNGKWNIDFLALIRDVQLPSGNREGVEFVFSLAEAENLPMAAFVDREFREFDYSQPLLDNLTKHYRRGDLFWSRGHSIENYFMNEECILPFLRMKFSEDIGQEYYIRTASQFPKVMTCAAALSLAVKDCELLSICGGAIKHTFWRHNPANDVQFDIDAFLSLLAGRTVPKRLRDDLRMRFNAHYANLVKEQKPEIESWLCHGHIGWSCLWTALAAIAASYTSSRAAIEAIAYGHNDEKMLWAADRWAIQSRCGNMEHPWDLVTVLLQAA